jgi:hypothetical protein
MVKSSKAAPDNVTAAVTASVSQSHALSTMYGEINWRQLQQSLSELRTAIYVCGLDVQAIAWMRYESCVAYAQPAPESCSSAGCIPAQKWQSAC